MNNYSKKAKESEKDYLKRLYSIKEAEHLTWLNIAQIANENLNYDFSHDKYRKDILKYIKEDYADLTDLSSPSDLVTLDDIKIEKVKLQDERTQLNAIYKRISREDSLKEMALGAANAINSKIKLKLPVKLNVKNNKKVAILQLSDIHYGIEDKTKWNEYSPEIAKQRINKLQDKVIEYLKKEKINTLYLVNLGDMIGGRIHLQLRLNSRIDVVTQAIEISEIISDFTNNLSQFANVHCYFTTDNHGRLEPSIKDAIDLESLSRLIPWYMTERLRANKNVFVHTNNNYGDDIVIFEALGHKIACCHGHKDKPNKIVSNLSLYSKEHFDMILSSHYHHLAVEEKNETIVVYNGSILSTDSFAEKLRLNSKPSQNLIICSEDDVMECLYKINLS